MLDIPQVDEMVSGPEDLSEATVPEGRRGTSSGARNGPDVLAVREGSSPEILRLLNLLERSRWSETIEVAEIAHRIRELLS